MQASTSIPFNKSIHISAIARLSLVSSIASTLRVAAWRGRLNEVPFVQLKYMLCAWAGLGKSTIIWQSYQLRRTLAC